MPKQPASPLPGRAGTISCPGSPAEVLERLDTAARRGKLPGFQRGSAAPGATFFELTDFGSPFEARLIASGAPSGSATELSFAPIRLKPLFPWVFALILVVSVWPGVWLTDSMIRTYWDWYSAAPWWITYAWYLPLTVPFCPVAMHSALRKSRASAAAEIPGILSKIAAATGGTINPARE
jgi:hypothetical protein